MALKIINKKKQVNLKQRIIQKFSDEIKRITSMHGINDNKILRFEFEIDKINPLTWLINQKDPVKIYWSGRDKTFELAGIGKADEISSKNFPSIGSAFNALDKRVKSSDANLKYFGGIAFSQTNKLDKFWKNFGRFYFVLPRFEIYNNHEKSFMAVNICNEQNIDFGKVSSNVLSKLEKINFNTSGEEKQDIKIINRTDLPDKKTWVYNIGSVVKKIKETDTQKIVLARKTIFESQEPVKPLLVLKMLKIENKHTYDFYMQPDETVSFLGCSPERLFKKTGRQILSEALAGSLTYGNNRQKNRSSEKLLLSSEKDIEEHQYVYDEIHKELLSLCEEIEVLNKKDILTLSYVQHIYSRFEGLLKSSKQIPEIISTLHPTPAVFGFPVEGLTNEIKKYELFDRGWYASPFGWISKDNADFTVSIRSGLINGKTISLFSGAGIVKGSIPELEWDEIENKIYHFLKILQ